MRFAFTKCVLSLLMILLLVPTMYSSPHSNLNDSGAKELQLNVVFHGLVSYVIWPDHIEVLIPQVDEHVYKAGSWGKELRLKESSVYRLTGVYGATVSPKIDTSNNLVLLKISNIDHSPSKLFCSFILPLPLEFRALRRARANGPIVAGRSLAANAPTSVPLVQTLVYQIEDVAKLSLGSGFFWRPEVTTMGTVNLHIWAEPEVDVTTAASTGHSAQAFSRLMALFPDVDLHLEFSAAAPADKVTDVRGLNGWEESSLVERQMLLFPKGQKRKSGKGTEVSNCIGVIVFNN